jgi:hypothetical protein
MTSYNDWKLTNALEEVFLLLCKLDMAQAIVHLETLKGRLADIKMPTAVTKLSTNPGELVACAFLKLKWVETMHGSDAIDCLDRGVELKTFIHMGKTKQINVNIAYPVTKGDRVTEILRHYRESPKYAGGWYFVAMNNRKTQVYYYYYITREAMVETIRQRLEADPTSDRCNLGSSVCKKCNTSHRLAVLQANRIHGIPPGRLPSSPCSKIINYKVVYA